MKPFLLENNIRKRKYAHKKIDKDFKHAILNQYGLNYQIDAKKKIIIFSTQIDTEIDEMGIYFLANNIDYDRINSEDVAKGRYCFNIEYSKNEVVVVLKDNKLNIDYRLNDYDLIWFRHFNVYINFDENTSSFEKAYCNKEWETLFSAIPQLFADKVLMPSCYDGFLTKPMQLKLANEVGLNIIPTVISNDFDLVKTFTNRNSKSDIAKAIYHHMFFTGKDNVVEFNTKNFNKLTLKDKASVSKVPAIFQPNYLTNDAHEIRVTVFGRRMVAYQYENYFGKDWHSRLKDLQVKKVNLSKELQNSIIQFFEKANITFGTVDFIIRSGKWYFLETNVNGDWAWLENLANTSFFNLLISTILEK